MMIFTGIVVTPFMLYGGTATSKILAPICTLPIAATLVATGVYYGRLEQRSLLETDEFCI